MYIYIYICICISDYPDSDHPDSTRGQNQVYATRGQNQVRRVLVCGTPACYQDLDDDHNAHRCSASWENRVFAHMTSGL